MEEITIIAIDLAKNVFQFHGMDAAGKVVLRRQLQRSQVLGFRANLRTCLIGMEGRQGCATGWRNHRRRRAHYWVRELIALGHDIWLMPPSFVKPYVQRGKTDAADAEAICEAVTRPAERRSRGVRPDTRGRSVSLS